jgi:hypothetical protein
MAPETQRVVVSRGPVPRRKRPAQLLEHMAFLLVPGEESPDHIGINHDLAPKRPNSWPGT